jgi:hypothetical protein
VAKQYGLKPPLTRPLEATVPPTSPSRALGTLAKLALVTEITEQCSTLSGDSCVSRLLDGRLSVAGNYRALAKAPNT